MEKELNIETRRSQHESKREWTLRRAFLQANVFRLNSEGISHNRLMCLANCFVNVRCYGCRYPDGVMLSLEEMSTGIKTEALTLVKSSVGRVPGISFVRASTETTFDKGAKRLASDSISSVSASFSTGPAYPSTGQFSQTTTREEHMAPSDKKPRIATPLKKVSVKKPLVPPTMFMKPQQRSTDCTPVIDAANRPWNVEALPEPGRSNDQLPNLQQLEDKFRMLADTLSSIAKSKLADKVTNMAQLFQIAVDKCKLSLSSPYHDVKSGFGCRVICDFVEVACGQANNKKAAKHAAFDAAAELLYSSYLWIDDSSSELRLIGSSEPRVIEPMASPVDDINRRRFESSLRLSEPHASTFTQKGRADSGNASRPISTTAMRQADQQWQHPQRTLMGIGKTINSRQGSSCFTNMKSSVHSVGAILLDDLLCDFVLRRPQVDRAAQPAVNILHESAVFNNVSLKYEFVDVEPAKVRCNVMLSDQVICDIVGDNRIEAKSSAAEKALDLIQSHCFTIIYKQTAYEDMPAANSVERDNILGTVNPHSGKADIGVAISDSNVGSRLLRKMGWSGVGGVGATGREGIAEPVSLDAVINREGLGLGTSKGVERDLGTKVARVIDGYLCKDEQEDLVFAPTFSKEERVVIHLVARKYSLRTRSYGIEPDRYLVLSRKRTPMELVAHIRANGGETYKYLLRTPTHPNEVLS